MCTRAGVSTERTGNWGFEGVLAAPRAALRAPRAEVDVQLAGVPHKLFRQGRGGQRGDPTTTVRAAPRTSLLFLPKHNNWPSICDAEAPVTAFGQHSVPPAFYANRASVAPCARTARTAREAPSLPIRLPWGCLGGPHQAVGGATFTDRLTDGRTASLLGNNPVRPPIHGNPVDAVTKGVGGGG